MAEAVLKVDGISQGPNSSCPCSLCVEFKERESEFDEKMLLMEEIAEEVLRKHLPEQVPITAKRLTFKLLDGYFQQESACHGLKHTTCRVIDAIKKKVNKTFPVASDVFERNLQTWLHGRKLSASADESTGDEDKCCSFCMLQSNEVLKRQGVEDDFEDDLEINLEKYFPEKSNSLEEMVELFLNAYILNHRPMNMKNHCFGEKFNNCLVALCIFDKCKDIFEVDEDEETKITIEETNQIAQNWFHEQREQFENLESVTIVDMESERTHTHNVMEIMLRQEWIGDANVMIHGILDAIFEKYFVGFILACGLSMEIPTRLYDNIFGILFKEHPQLEVASYQDCVAKWFASRV